MSRRFLRGFIGATQEAAPNRRVEAVAVVVGGLGFARCVAVLPQAEERTHAVSRDGASEQPALRLRAAEILERGADLLRLHTLGGDGNVERVSEAGDGADDRRGPVALDDGRDEALVDLYPVDRPVGCLRPALL